MIVLYCYCHDTGNRKTVYSIEFTIMNKKTQRAATLWAFVCVNYQHLYPFASAYYTISSMPFALVVE